MFLVHFEPIFHFEQTKHSSSFDLKQIESSTSSTKYELSIKYKKTHISGSPFKVEVSNNNTRLLEMEAIRKLDEDLFDLRKEIDKMQRASELATASLKLCKNCNTQVVSAVVFPCSHVFYCQSCAEKLFADSAACSCDKRVQGYSKFKIE